MEKKDIVETPRKKRQIPAPQRTPIYKVSMSSMVWNISIGHVGLAVWLCCLAAPVHLLIS